MYVSPDIWRDMTFIFFFFFRPKNENLYDGYYYRSVQYCLVYKFTFGRTIILIKLRCVTPFAAFADSNRYVLIIIIRFINIELLITDETDNVLVVFYQ